MEIHKEPSESLHHDRLQQDVVKNRLGSIIGSDEFKRMSNRLRLLLPTISTSMYHLFRILNSQHLRITPRRLNRRAMCTHFLMSLKMSIPTCHRGTNSHPNAPAVDVDEPRHEFSVTAHDSGSTSHFQSQYELVLVEVLSLLRIPYCRSVHEAESQCAFLNESDLVDYVISDDSDVFLFGNVRVIRSFYKRTTSPISTHLMSLQNVCHCQESI